jgi:very-short-patch-repair endonuclease
VIQGDEKTIKRARALRRKMSLPEVLLWQRLKSRPGGFKFRKQHPATPFVFDFYCHELRLIVEIDGVSHDMGDRPERDADRDAHFRAKGFRILRIPASDVLRDPDEVAEAIASYCYEARSAA